MIDYMPHFMVGLLITLVVLMGIAGYMEATKITEGTLIKKQYVPTKSTMKTGVNTNGDMTMLPTTDPEKFIFTIKDGNKTANHKVSETIYNSHKIGDYINMKTIYKEQ